MRRYLLLLAVLVVVLAIIITALGSKLVAWQQIICGYILGYFTVVTIISHLGLERATKSRPQVFVRYYMASTSLRLLAHLIVIVSYSILVPANARFFIIVFMILYFVFTIFEVAYVMKNKNL